MVRNSLLISGVCLIISLVLGLTLIYPKSQDLAILRKQVKEKEAELESLKAYFADLQDISQELQKYQSQLSKIDSALPEKSSFPEILDFIQKSASQSGLLLIEIGQIVTTRRTEEVPPEEIPPEGAEEVPKEVKTSRIKETRINLKLIGDYASFKNFLPLLEQSARLFEIENLSFSSTEKGLDFNLVIKTYSY